MKYISFLYILFFLFLGTNTYSQYVEMYFSETERLNRGITNAFFQDQSGIYIGGSSFDIYNNQPTLRKIDTTGNVIWSTSEYDSSFSTDIRQKIESIEMYDGYIYTISKIGQNDYRSVWKINPQNGEIIWKSEFKPNAQNGRFTKIINYDENRVILAFHETYNAGFVTLDWVFINKISGAKSSTYNFGEVRLSQSNYSVVVDKDKFIYLTKEGEHGVTLIRLNNIAPYDILYTKTYEQDYEHQTLHIDENDRLFILGEVCREINKLNGQTIWENNAFVNSGKVNKIWDINDQIYLGWKSNINNRNPLLQKLDKNNGQVIWEFSKETNTLGSNFINSLILDNNGDLTLTGEIGVSDFSQLFTSKIDDLSGIEKSTFILPFNNNRKDSLSRGIGIINIDDEIFTYGERMTSYYGAEHGAPFVLKLDPDSFIPLFQKEILGNFQFQSEVIKVEKYDNNKTLIFKEKGRKIVIELLDFDKSLIWRRIFSRDEILKCHKIKVGHDGTIIFSAYGLRIRSNYPNTQEYIDSVYFYRLHPNGNLLAKGAYASTLQPKDIELVGDNPIIFYGRTVFSILDENGLSEPVNAFDNIISVNPNQLNHVFASSDQSYKYIGTRSLHSGGLSGGGSTRTYGGSARNINFFSPINSSNILNNRADILLCGESFGRKETLIRLDPYPRIIWEQTYDDSSQIVKFIFNKDSTSIYSMSKKETYTSIKNISTSDGELVWAYDYDCLLGDLDIPTDIIFDESKSEIILTGYSQIDQEGNKEPFILKIKEINSVGYFHSEYFPQSSKLGNNIINCVEQLPDGSIWVGGKINNEAFGKAGFIFELDSIAGVTSINGSTFYDENENGILDSNEGTLSFIKTYFEPSLYLGFSNFNGSFNYFLNEGQYRLAVETPENWKLTTDSIYDLDINSVQNISNLDFGFTPILDTTANSVIINSGFTRCSRYTNVEITSKNFGTTIDEGILWFQTDTLIDSIQFISNPDTVFNDHTFGWFFNDLLPFECINKKFSVKIPGIEDGIILGQRLNFKAYVNIESDTFSYQYSPEIRCSFDPNDKLVTPNRVEENYTLFDEQLYYTIRFQNTGNDTAFDITIRDTIDADLDIKSLEIVSSSHLDILEVLIKNQTVEFVLKNIMLPDSSNTYETSQGYITFKIRSKKQIPEFSEAMNKAEIYFDFNPPIITNTVLNTLVEEFPVTSISSLSENNDQILVYPNPINNYFNLVIDSIKKINDLKVDFYDIYGKLILSQEYQNINENGFTNQYVIDNSHSGIFILSVNIDGTKYLTKILRINK